MQPQNLLKIIPAFKFNSKKEKKKKKFLETQTTEKSVLNNSHFYRKCKPT